MSYIQLHGSTAIISQEGGLCQFEYWSCPASQALSLEFSSFPKTLGMKRKVQFIVEACPGLPDISDADTEVNIPMRRQPGQWQPCTLSQPLRDPVVLFLSSRHCASKKIWIKTLMVLIVFE